MTIKNLWHQMQLLYCTGTKVHTGSVLTMTDNLILQLCVCVCVCVCVCEYKCVFREGKRGSSVTSLIFSGSGPSLTLNHTFTLTNSHTRVHIHLHTQATSCSTCTVTHTHTHTHKDFDTFTQYYFWLLSSQRPFRTFSSNRLGFDSTLPTS